MRRGKIYLVGERVCGQVSSECRRKRISRPLRRTTAGAGFQTEPDPNREQRTGGEGRKVGKSIQQEDRK